MTDIADWVDEWFNRKGPLPGRTPEERRRTDYFSAGLIDSLGVVELVGEIEERFAIAFRPEDFQDRRFSTFGGLVQIIAERVEAGRNSAAEGQAFEGWGVYYAQATRDGCALAWPCETLVRLFQGSYVPGLNKEYRGKSLLDVGFGGGNNFVFLASLGLALHGTEVDEAICRMARERLGRLGIEADLRLGTNRSLPYPDDTHDFLVSWNVIHYEQTDSTVTEAIAEYARVLKPAGRLFLSTTGPDHLILRDAQKLGDHWYRIMRADDFRRGDVHFNFETKEFLAECLSARFTQVHVGRTHDVLFTDTLDWFIATGLKPS